MQLVHCLKANTVWKRYLESLDMGPKPNTQLFDILQQALGVPLQHRLTEDESWGRKFRDRTANIGSVAL